MDGTDSRNGAAVVPAVDLACSVASIRSLGRRGVRTVGVSEKDSPMEFQSKYCDETWRVPNPDENLSAYGDALLSIARRPDVRTIVPVREADVFVLAERRDAFAEHVGTPWPSLETLRLVQDRARLFDVAEAAGVPTPETRRFDEWNDWDRNVVIKPRYTLPAPEYLGERPDEPVLDATTVYVDPDEPPDRASVVAEMGHEPMVQEFVPGSDEYGFFALYDRGTPVATFQHRQRRGLKYCGGPSAYRESIAVPELEAAGRRLLDRLDWHGLAMVEFLREEATGEFVLMEVNPRFWSSLPFTVQAGVDFPYLYWLQANGRPSETAPDYEVGIAGHLLRGELLYVHSLLAEEYPLVERPPLARSVLDVAASLVRDRRFDLLSADDPGPFVREMRNLAAGTFDRYVASERDAGGGATGDQATVARLLGRQ